MDFEVAELDSMFVWSQVFVVELCDTNNAKTVLRHIHRRVWALGRRVDFVFDAFFIAFSVYSRTMTAGRWIRLGG